LEIQNLGIGQDSKGVETLGADVILVAGQERTKTSTGVEEGALVNTLGYYPRHREDSNLPRFLLELMNNRAEILANRDQAAWGGVIAIELISYR
jgi:hypothetical protein